MTTKKPKYRVLKDFEIHEISAVDRPAQAGARAVIMKRETTPVMKTAALTSVEEGHGHLISLEDSMSESKAGHTSYERLPGSQDGHTHNWIMTPEGEIVIQASMGHTHSIAQLSKDTGGGAAATQPQQIEPMKTEKQDGGAEIQAQVTELTKRAERAEKVAELNDEQKAHMAKLEKGEQQDKFLALSPEQREAEIAKTREADPVVYTTDEGVALRKSAGDLAVSMAKRLDEQSRKLAKAEELAKRQELEKRAAEFVNLPGELPAKVALLGAVDGIKDEAVRKSVLEILKADDAGLGEAFKEHGTSEAPATGDAEAQLETMAKRIAEEKKVTLAKGWELAALTPEGRALYAQIVG